MRNTLAVVDWQDVGPRVFAYLREEVPGRKTLRGIGEDCVTALGLTVDAKRLLDWLSARSSRDEWNAIKRTLGTGRLPPDPFFHSDPSVSSPPPVAGSPSLLDRLREKTLNAKRAVCPVCTKLPAEMRRQIEDAKTKGYPLRDILAILAEDGYVIRADEFTAHYTQRH